MFCGVEKYLPNLRKCLLWPKSPPRRNNKSVLKRPILKGLYFFVRKHDSLQLCGGWTIPLKNTSQNADLPHIKVNIFFFKNPPVEVGSLSHYLQGFSTIPNGCLGFPPSTVVFNIFTLFLNCPPFPPFPFGSVPHLCKPSLPGLEIRSLAKRKQKSFILTWLSGWWFQPIWKILVKLDHFPR